jgi:NitT/TauT family transport system substrate-binding protein
VVRAFRSALVQAQQAAARTAPVQATLQHLGGWTKETAALVTLGSYPTSVSAAELQRVATLMSFYGVPAPLTVSGMIFH